MKNYLRDNLKGIVTFFFTIALTLVLLEPLSELFLKFEGLFKTKNISFQVGYWLFVSFIISYYFIKIEKRYIYSKTTTFFVLYFTAVYIMFRLICTEYIAFTKLYKAFVYADIVFVIFCFHLLGLLRVSSKNIFSFIEFFKKGFKNFILKLKSIVKYIKSYFSKKKTEKENSFEDNKSTFFLEDTTDVKGNIDNQLILEELINRVSKFKPKEAFSIGLNASWGYGKSTFLTRFKNLYEKKNPKEIVFWYRIWKNRGANAVIENFFTELKKQLAPFSGEISGTIDKYVKAILSLSNSDLKKLIEVGKNLLQENETLEEYHDGINKTIKKIDKQIIILLDDLDRLETDEILTTLKMIRTLSDFNNVIFIAGYDREYVVKKIQDSTIKTNYLDKIFNVEINLLPFNVKTIDDELFRLIDYIFPNKINEADNNIFNEGFKNLFKSLKEQSITEVLTPSLELMFENNNSEKRCEAKHEYNYQTFLPTYRDIKRFLNEFKFYASFIEKKKVGNTTDIIVSEFILLKLLIYKYRDVNAKILSRIDDFLEKKQIDFEGNTEYFGYDGNIYEYNKSEEELKKDFPYYDDQDISIINSVLCRLFGRKPVEFYKKNFNSISKVYYTDLYIKNNILSDTVFITELQQAFNEKRLFDFVTKLKTKIELTKNYSLTNEIKYFIFKILSTINSKENFLDVLKALQILLNRINNSDSITILQLLTNAKKVYFSDDRLAFKDAISDVVNQNEFNGVLDFLFSDINIDLKRINSGLYKNNELINYKILPLEKEELKEIYLSKLSFLIDNDSDCNWIYSSYSLQIEALVLNKKILLHKEGGEKIKEDIKRRFKEYYKADFFKSIREGVKDLEGEFKGYVPFFSLSQIFSNKETLNALVEQPDEETYNRFYNEGWENFNEFLEEQIERLQEDSSFKKLDQLIKGQKFVEAYINKGCTALTKEEHDKIWKN
ncbi:P-loop NTPase fold protein [Tenacibaculum aiptasiae]|uniref:P-loop NTPase fold protein n=1 Tax=Tenacibaculum aiptasiae TaxID=426481 RepID=UPI003B5A54ED